MNMLMIVFSIREYSFSNASVSSERCVLLRLKIHMSVRKGVSVRTTIFYSGLHLSVHVFKQKSLLILGKIIA